MFTQIEGQAETSSVESDHSCKTKRLNISSLFTFFLDLSTFQELYHANISNDERAAVAAFSDSAADTTCHGCVWYKDNLSVPDAQK